MTLHKDIEKEYYKRKKEAEDRASQILYGKSAQSEISEKEIETPEYKQIQENISDKEIEQIEQKTEPKRIVEPLELNLNGRKVYRYVGDPPEPPPKVYGPKRPKCFLIHERSEFILKAQKAGLMTMSEDGFIIKPDGIKVKGVFRRA